MGDLARIDIAPADGTAYSVVRDPGSEDFRLESPPEGRKVKPRSLGRVAGSVARLQLLDVEPRGGFNPEGQGHAAVFTLENDIEIRATLIENGEAHWLLVDARYMGQGDGDSAAEARKEAEAIAARTADWAYRIDRGAFERMTIPLDELLEEKDESS